MADAHHGPKLAARRPAWELPEVHSGLQLAPMDSLYNYKERMKCLKCGRLRAHYCYDCLQPLVPFPHVDLPFRVSIVTHHEEKASKNTGVQAAILARDQVDLHDMSHTPTDVEPSRCAVLFPSDTALEVEQLEPDSIDRLFIIDSRWKKANSLMRTETFRTMRAVRLSHTRSAFWRFHTRGVAEAGVCTIEALFFFLDALAKQGKLRDPRFSVPHVFDNLLWYFVYQHQVVQQAAQKRVSRGQKQGDATGEERKEAAQSHQRQQQQGQSPKLQERQQQKQNQPRQKQQRQQPSQEVVGKGGGEGIEAMVTRYGRQQPTTGSAHSSDPEEPRQQQQQQHVSKSPHKLQKLEGSDRTGGSSPDMDTALTVVDPDGDSVQGAGTRLRNRHVGSDNAHRAVGAGPDAEAQGLLIHQADVIQNVERGLDQSDAAEEDGIDDAVPCKAKRARR
ncbi:hypothetical protein Vretimale_15281 [Volvox reticuliferus]|uniref:tRNA-uridine aminocarboxypropyltransferase 1 n=1 Tax=Volvox reticuliferus TaxID=1737510 RepID=A0A8J4LW13_9CHLO|nr:hypothetical protein Vretifemale_5479 [Volvox reticuliferus]GIM11820.1 hypothetical protein Vretimale_15281 [Volvox reticuliferus]